MQKDLPKGVWVLAWDKSGKLLTVTRPGKETTGLPGGRVEPNETFEAAAIRELREETSVEASEKDLNFIFQDVCEADSISKVDYDVKVFSLSFLVDAEKLRGREEGVRPILASPKEFLENTAFPVFGKKVMEKFFS